MIIRNVRIRAQLANEYGTCIAACFCIDNKGIAVDKAKHDEEARGSARREDNSSSKQTSGNREESMGASSDDAFGKQRSADSGTTSLAGESGDADEKPGPGGVEGVSSNR